MSDRAITIPPSFKTAPNTESYTMQHFFAEFIWPFPRWSDDEHWGDRQIDLGAKLENLGPGDVWELREADWEKIRDAAKAAQLTGRPYPPNVAPKLRYMQRAILQANIIPAPSPVK